MKKTTKMIMVAFLAFTLAGAAITAKRTGGPCKQDIQKFCQGKKGAQARDCLIANKDKLSTNCKKMQERAEIVNKACQADIQKFCAKYTKSKKANPMKCLMYNKAKLSKGCQQALPKRGPKGNRPPRPRGQ